MMEIAAVPVDTPEAEARVREILRARTGTLGFHLIRTFLLFADIKPVRLDPRDEIHLSAIAGPRSTA